MTLLDDLGIEACTVSFGKEASFAGIQADVSISVEPRALGISGPLNVRWVASGDMLTSFIDEQAADAGQQGIIRLPTTGQDGFARGTQLFKGWFYVATINRRLAGKSIAPRVYRFQIPAGTLSMDLDAFDEDGQVTALPAFAPMPTVTSFLGLTGAITQDQIPGQPPTGGAGGALAGFYPNPGLNENNVEAIIAGRIGTPGSTTRTAVDGRAASAANAAQAAAATDATSKANAAQAAAISAAATDATSKAAAAQAAAASDATAKVSAAQTAATSAASADATAKDNALSASIAAKYLAFRSTPPSASERAAGVVGYWDTSTVPPVPRGWNGSAWVAVGGTAADLALALIGAGVASLSGAALTQSGAGVAAVNSTLLTSIGGGVARIAA